MSCQCSGWSVAPVPHGAPILSSRSTFDDMTADVRHPKPQDLHWPQVAGPGGPARAACGRGKCPDLDFRSHVPASPFLPGRAVPGRRQWQLPPVKRSVRLLIVAAYLAFESGRQSRARPAPVAALPD